MKRRFRRGGASMLALLSMAVLLTASVGVFGYAATDMSRASREETSLVCFQAAQAGLEQGVSAAFVALKNNKGKFVLQTTDVSTDVNAIAPGCSAKYYIVPQSDPTRAYVTCTVTYSSYTKSVRMAVRAKNVGIWNNAIFAGTGAAGRAINGNVDIRGSVHVLGDGEAYSDLNGNGQWDGAESFTDKNHNGVWDPGEPFVDANNDGIWNSAEPFNDTNGNGFYDPPLTSTDLNSSLSGTAYIGNNYSGMPSGLEAMVPTAPTVSGIETLSAELRVKHGRVSISGNASIGSSSVIDGGTSKSTLDATYVSDGFTGSAGSGHVYSDNGSSSAYDLGNLNIKLPLLSGIGAESEIVDGTSYSTHGAYLDSKSMTVPISSITSTTAAFSYGPDANGNSISFTPASGSTPAKLTINGIVKVSGNLQIGAKDTITYQGSGTFYADNVYIDGNFLPASGQTFPTTTRVGLIASQNMYLATGNGSSQLSLAGAFYAQGKIVSAKQNQIAGTFVANYFDMGTNVPNIYQVPELAYNLPPGMPGSDGIYTLSTQAWRERLSTELN